MSMDARFHRICRSVLAMICCLPLLGASYRTTNFVVVGPNRAIATEVGINAERFRRDLAIEWLGRELPSWSQPCPIRVNVNPTLGASGMTKFTFYNDKPFDWEMSLSGSRERILDSVLPHEVTHTIFATHFGQPLPRWADEGACTSVEHASERRKQDEMLIGFIEEKRGIPFNRMFAMKDYPRDLIPLYAQGHSVAVYLIQQGGKRKFVQFVGAGLETQDWHGSLKQYYNYDRIADLQIAWEKWIGQGRPTLNSADIQLASTTSSYDESAAVRPAPMEREANGSLSTAGQLTSNSTRPLIQTQAPITRGSWYARVSNGDTSNHETKVASSHQSSLKSTQDPQTRSRAWRNQAESSNSGDTDWQSLAPESRRRFLR